MPGCQNILLLITTSAVENCPCWPSAASVSVAAGHRQKRQLLPDCKSLLLLSGQVFLRVLFQGQHRGHGKQQQISIIVINMLVILMLRNALLTWGAY